MTHKPIFTDEEEIQWIPKEELEEIIVLKPK